MFNTRVSLYEIFILLAIISGLSVVYINSKNIKLRNEEKIGLMLYIALGAIFGGKYYAFIINIKKYNCVFNLFKVGLSSYGAIIGIIVLLLIYSKQFKKKFIELIYIMLPSIPLMYGIGKIGCFLAGCCYGFEYNGLLSVVYNYSYPEIKGLHLFPVQLLEAIAFILIYVYIYSKFRKNETSLKLIGQAFIICGLAKFLLDFFRMNHLNTIITINQVFSILFILAGIILILIKNNK